MSRIAVTASIVCLFILLPVSGSAEVSFVDSSGKTVTVAQPFSRIISLYSAHTENLMSLGAEGELIGISTTDDYPPQALTKPRYSYREDPEKFIAARPDLVLVRPMIERSYPQLIDKLRQAGITVISLQPTSVEEIFDYWLTLGMLTGRTAEAQDMISRFQKDLAEISARIAQIPFTQRRRVYFEAIHNKMKTFAPTSIAIYTLEQAGGINVAGDALRVRQTNIAAYGKERILAKSEEIDVFLAQRGRMNPVQLDAIKKEPGFQAVRAVREGRVFLVDESIVSRPTLRIIEGIQAIGSILYPEIFQHRITEAGGYGR